MDSYNYIDSRLLPQIKYYETLSKRSHNKYRIMSISNIVLTALIPVISLSPIDSIIVKYVVAILSAIVSIFTSVIYLDKYKETWIQFRTTAESIKSEYAKFCSHTCDYKNINNEERINLLITRCENLMNDSHTNWIEFTTN